MSVCHVQGHACVGCNDEGGGGAGAIKNGKINSVLAAAACGQPRRGRSTSVYVPSRLLCLGSKRWGHCDNQL